jgi:Ser/Thr protein kinase RdoA (MazF antagonist)
MAERTTPLPDDLRALLARERMAIARAAEVTKLWDPGVGPRRTFRIELAGGGCVKGRTHRNAEVAARIAQNVPLAAAHGLAAVLAWGGTATLEEWVAGEPLAPQDEAAAEQAGALLGAVHAALPVERIGAEDPRAAAFCELAPRWLETVRAAGALTAAASARVLAAVSERPRSARWGLYHGDFSPENLVIGAGRVRCVDNTTVRPDLLDPDLAFSVNRWPLAGAVRERFLRGYERHADLEPFLASETFWRVGAALRSAAYRIRERAGDASVPLFEIAHLVA